MFGGAPAAAGGFGAPGASTFGAPGEWAINRGGAVDPGEWAIVNRGGALVLWIQYGMVSGLLIEVVLWCCGSVYGMVSGLSIEVVLWIQ
jgi:hypothetical protein